MFYNKSSGKLWSSWNSPSLLLLPPFRTWCMKAGSKRLPAVCSLLGRSWLLCWAPHQFRTQFWHWYEWVALIPQTVNSVPHFHTKKSNLNLFYLFIYYIYFYILYYHILPFQSINDAIPAQSSQSPGRQESLLTSVRYTSSSCTGSFSGEMALAVVEKTVNRSGVLDRPLCYTPVQCHETLSENIWNFWNSGWFSLRYWHLIPQPNPCKRRCVIFEIGCPIRLQFNFTSAHLPA